MWERENNGTYVWDVKAHGLTPPKISMADDGEIVNDQGYVMASSFPSNDEKSLSSADKPLILRASQKRKPNIIYGKVKTQQAITGSNKVKNTPFKDEILAIAVAIDADVDELRDSLTDIINNNRDWNYDSVDINAGYFYFVKVKNARAAMREKLEDEEHEYLGGFSTELIKEAFQRIRNHSMSDSVIDALVNSDNYTELGMMMANTHKFMDEFINVMIHKYGEKQTVTDVMMGGETTHTMTLCGVEYYIGGY